MYITKLPFEGKFKVTYPYGIKDSAYAGGYHQGIDMGNSINPNIYSIVNGVVAYAGWENVNNPKQGFGKYVSIKFDQTVNGFKKVYLAHMSEVKVSVGQKVNPATIIGIMGSTGMSTGPHTHLEIREYNAKGQVIRIINPATFMGIPNVIGVYDSANYRVQIGQAQVAPVQSQYKHKVNELVKYSTAYPTANGTNYSSLNPWQRQYIVAIIPGARQPYKLKNGWYINDGDIRG